MEKADKKSACIMIGVGVFRARITKGNDDVEIGEGWCLFHRRWEKNVLFDITFVYTKMKLINYQIG